MSILMVVRMIIALATAATGFLALIKPTAVFGFTGLNVSGARGISEIRAIFGGLFVGLGFAPIILGSAAYIMLGICYLSIATVRTFSIIFDKAYTRSNWISLGIEIVLGVLLVV